MNLEHPWNLTPAQAVECQCQLCRQVELSDRFGQIRSVAGVDVGFEEGGRVTRAAVSVLSFPSLMPIEDAIYRCPTQFPYIPGLLSFRELPAVLGALSQLNVLPDLFLCDGQGYAHPRRFGIACHLGLLTDTPSIGVAKSRLIGKFAEPEVVKGAWTPLLDGDDVIGSVLRTRTGVNPLFISPGHRVGFESSIQLVMDCTTRYRLPETTRAAHRLASMKSR